MEFVINGASIYVVGSSIYSVLWMLSPKVICSINVGINFTLLSYSDGFAPIRH